MPQDLGSLEKVLRVGEGRRLKRLKSQAEYITSLEPDFEELSDDELAGKTVEFKQRLENGQPLEELVFEAYAAVREAFKRTLGVRLFDVQVMGGIVLHEGDIAEMKTGEGKTFVAVQPLYLNALTGNGVHLVTVNDYLAKRDAGWMGPVYEKLGMRAAYIENLMPFAERKEAYEADITYGTNSEFGFDYLRDNMAVALDGVVQRGHHYGIVDEVDSILIDEARTPLIISGEPETAVKIATNMAGRGVDIKLGEGVVELGGLYVLGTERHEARRIDNQLRGRSGRQGDPGESRFYLSGQDDLVRLFAGNRIYNIMDRFKVPEDQPMEARILSNQIENAQKKVEEQNFVARKNVLKYDDVLNKQRSVIYDQRRRVLEGQDLSDEVKAWIDDVIERTITQFTENEYAEEWDLEGLVKAMDTLYVQPAEEPITVEELREDVGSLTRETLIEDFSEEAQERYAAKEQELGPELMRELERFIILQVVDNRWRQHLDNMDYLREGVHLRAMAQKDPLVEYTAEGHIMFEELNAAIREEVILHLFHAQLEPQDAAELQQLQEAQAADGGGLAYEHQSLAGAQAIGAAAGGDGSGNGASVTAGTLSAGGSSVATATRTVSDREKIGRNDPCWCGSGKKFKKCHGA